ncbi:MAG: hypothetical protein HYS38_06950 [Acidobacteria bacterium]|nr:hypothetical protein [Acidobacteriota bacterium]
MNVILAELLQERGLVAAPEQILRGAAGDRNMPDVIVDFRGLRLQLECEFAGRNKAEAKLKAFEKAKERVEEAIAHIGVAVVYPAFLKDVSFDRAKKELSKCELEYSVVTEAIIVAPGDQLRLFVARPEPVFSRGTVDNLGDALRRCYEQLVRDETLDAAVKLLETRIAGFLNALGIQAATAVRMARVLGVEDLPDNARVLTLRQRIAVGKITALIIVNALIFQEVLSQNNARVSSLQALRIPVGLVGEMRRQWEFILNQINYYPIFYTAEKLLECLAADQEINRSLRNLLETALIIVGWRASLRHDLAGRIYHRLLEEAKYLGAYYTSIPSAALLLKLALQPDRYSVDWSSPEAITRLRIADLACGTGTLLMAAADSVIDNHVRISASKRQRPQASAVNQLLAKEVLWGYDVLPSAIHLTASTLALRVPESPMDKMNLFRVLHGGDHGYLGTLEALDPAGARGTLFSQPQRIGGRGAESVVEVTLPRLDLCVMNPPFTSSRKGNHLFGSVPDEQRAQMQRRLGRLVNQQNLSASITAGLGSIFVALGDRYLKAGGRLALVLQKAVLSGIAWEPTRHMISQNYVLEYVVVSHEVSHWNFSENTNLTEALVIAKKLIPGEHTADHRVIFINLWRQPRTATESLSLSHALASSNVHLLGSGDRPTSLKLDDRKFGEAFSIEWASIQNRSWALPCSFAQAELVAAFMKLVNGHLHLPQRRLDARIALCNLRNFAEVGPDPRDVYDAFSLAESERTKFPSLWGHNAKMVRFLAAKPNLYLHARTEPLPGRPLRSYELVWQRAGRVLVVQRIRLNTKRVVSVRMDRRVLSDVWWPVDLNEHLEDREELEKCLVLWLNSTLGLFLLLGMREETEGAWVQYKKPMWEEMPVLDVTRIGRRVRNNLAKAYDQLSTQEIDFLPNLGSDGTRSRIDDAISKVLGLPDLRPLREALASEPILRQDMAGLLLDA